MTRVEEILTSKRIEALRKRGLLFADHPCTISIIESQIREAALNKGAKGGGVPVDTCKRISGLIWSPGCRL